jgi:tetratricopeptide (TPR) repeat protein
MHHLTDLELEQYRKRDMPPERLLVANSHLFDCEQCYRRYGAEDKVEAAFTILRDLQSSNKVEAEHCSFEQLADYVDDNLNEKSRAEIDLHVQECAGCEARLKELSGLRPLVVTPAPKLLQEKRLTLQQRFFAFLQPRLIFQLAGLLLIAALLLWAITLKRRVNGLEQEVSQLEKANELLVKNSGTANDPTGIDVSKDNPSLPEAPANVVALNDAGGQIALDKTGNLTGFSELSPVYEKSIKEALTKARLQLPRMPSGAGKADVFMGTTEEGSFSLISPVGKIVQSVRPVFRWKTLKGATSYQIFVKDSAGNMIESGELKTSEWMCDVPLKRGMLYSWQVVALKDGREVIAPAPAQTAAQIKILGQTAIDELTEVKKSHPDAHLLLGILYAKTGLLDEAVREFTILLKNNPQSDVVKKLLNTVKARSS